MRRDILGRITRKSQVLTGGETRAVTYSYRAAGTPGAGQLATITYPSGKQLSHSYDSSGRLTALNWAGQPLVTNITWNPLGQPTGWRWAGFASAPGSTQILTEARTYTDAAQLARSALFNLTWDGAGRVSRITQQHMLLTSSTTVAQQTGITSAYTYDRTGRLTASAHSATPAQALPSGWSLSDIIGPNSMGYAYDANGNRTQAYYSTTTPQAQPRCSETHRPPAAPTALLTTPRPTPPQAATPPARTSPCSTRWMPRAHSRK